MPVLKHGAIRRGGRVVLPPAALRLPATGTVGVVGVNGAGKSTLFQALAGALRPSLGTATLEPRPASAAVAWAPQQPAFPGWLDVACVAWLYGIELTDLFDRFPGLLLEELGGKRAGSLSVGQRQALSVALALALDAPLTILDEPFASLDFRRRVGLVRHLLARRAPHARGITLVSSQSAADLLETCDWVVVMREGEYIFSGEVAELAESSDAVGGGEARQRLEQALLALLAAAAPLQG